MIAGVYSRFDTLRVSDATSHDAFQVLNLENRPDEQHLPKMKEELAKYGVPKSPEMTQLCADVKHLGPPNYHPDYMIAHGMGGFFGGGLAGRVASDFDVRKGWKDALDKYLHCDVSDMN